MTVETMVESLVDTLCGILIDAVVDTLGVGREDARILAALPVAAARIVIFLG